MAHTRPHRSHAKSLAACSRTGGCAVLAAFGPAEAPITVATALPLSVNNLLGPLGEALGGAQQAVEVLGDLGACAAK